MRWGRGKAAGAKPRWASAPEVVIIWLKAGFCMHRICCSAEQHLPPADRRQLACPGWLPIHSGRPVGPQHVSKVWSCADSMSFEPLN